MNIAREAGSIPEAYRDLLEGRTCAVLATVMPDGQPQSTVVWCDVDGDDILITSQVRSTRMNPTPQPHPPLIWRGIRKLNRRLAAQVIGRGRGPRGVVLLLTTIGRKSGQPRVTPLQYEEDQGVIYMASARGPHADWFRNIQANPHVKVQIADRVFEGLAETIVDPARIADFLRLRLKRHPIMMRAMLALEGQWRCRQTDLERFAASKALVAIRPQEKESKEL